MFAASEGSLVPMTNRGSDPFLLDPNNRRSSDRQVPDGCNTQICDQEAKHGFDMSRHGRHAVHVGQDRNQC